MQEVKQSDKRLNHFDALRGFAMFLVVMGHIMQFSFGIGGYKTFLSHIIVSVHLPIFFFVSGFFAHKDQSSSTSYIYSNIKRKAFVFLVPATFFFSLYTYIKCGNPLLSFTKYGFDAYWFTYVLFEMFCIYYLVLLIGKNSKTTDVLLIVFSLFGVYALASFDRNNLIWKYFILENFFKYFQFFTFGILFRKYYLTLEELLKREVSKTLSIIVFLISIILSFNDSFKTYNSFVYSIIHDEVFRYAGLILIYIIFVSKNGLFEKYRRYSDFLLLMGRRTLDIYFIHYFLLPNLHFFTPYINNNDMFLIQLIVTFIIAIIVTFISLKIGKIIRISDFCAFAFLGEKRNKK